MNQAPSQRSDVAMTDRAALRWTGIAGIAGAALLLAADWVMLGAFTSAREFRANWLPLLAEMPRWRLVAGASAGPIGAWLYVVGFWQLYLALRPAGRCLAFLVFAGFSMSFVWIAGAFHSSFPFMAALWRLHAAGAPAEVLADDPIFADAFAYARLLYAGGLPPALLACVLLAYAILRRPTAYPRWFAALNPLLLYVSTLPFEYLPAPLGGPLVIGAGNLVFLVFFVVSTATLAQQSRHARPDHQ